MSTLPPAPPQDNPIQVFPAFCSMLLPGLGQLLQKRFGEAFVFFFFFCPVAFPTFIALSGARFNSEFVPFTICFLVVHILYVFFALVDTILWQYDHKPHFIESLVVFGVISLLIILLLPAVPFSHNAKQRLQCSNQIRQILIGLHNYHDIFGCFPPAYTVDADGNPLHSWRVLILPYIEETFIKEKNLYQQIRLDEPWDSEYNKQFHFHSQIPTIFRCPSMEKNGAVALLTGKYHHIKAGCCYSVVIGKETPFPGSESTTLESIDDKENTVLLVERMTPVNWMNPMSDMSFETASCGVNVELTGIGSGHHRGCNCAMADGTVRFIADTIEPDKLKEMLKSKKDMSR